MHANTQLVSIYPNVILLIPQTKKILKLNCLVSFSITDILPSLSLSLMSDLSPVLRTKHSELHLLVGRIITNKWMFSSHFVLCVKGGTVCSVVCRITTEKKNSVLLPLPAAVTW